MLAQSGARGLMIGRGAIRNPWVFEQIRQALRGEKVFRPTGRDVLGYVTDLFESTRWEPYREGAHVQKMKKYMNFLGEGVSDAFLAEIRRVATREAFFGVVRCYLDHGEPVELAVPTDFALAGPNHREMEPLA